MKFRFALLGTRLDELKKARCKIFAASCALPLAYCRVFNAICRQRDRAFLQLVALSRGKFYISMIYMSRKIGCFLWQNFIPAASGEG